MRIFIALSITAMFGCSNPNEPEVILREEAKAMQPEDVLRDNLRATQGKDIDGFLKTIDEKAPNRDSLRSVMTSLFELYELDYKLEKMEKLEMNDHLAKFRIVLTTRKKTGPEFTDNRVTYTQLLVKNNNEWRLSETIQEKVEFI